MQKKLNKNGIIINTYKNLNMHLYLFGSSTKIKTPNDLDILILYPENAVKQAINIKNYTIQYLEDSLDIKIDCILLSIEEEQEVSFIVKEKAMCIFPQEKITN